MGANEKNIVRLFALLAEIQRNGVSGYSGSIGPTGASGFSGFSGTGGTGSSGLSGRSGFSGVGVSGQSGKSGFSGFSGNTGSLGAFGGNSLAWYFNGNYDDADPDVLNFGMNASSFDTVTNMSFSLFDWNAADTSSWLQSLRIGDRIRITDMYTQYTWAIYEISDLLTAGGAFWGFKTDYIVASDPSAMFTLSVPCVVSLAHIGESGISGADGSSGTSGFSGRSGYSGFSGISGSSGTSGFSGTSGRSGYSGVSGFAGASGSSGVSGFSGTSGNSGFSGTDGLSGTSGRSGFSGSSGASGASGFSGIGTSGFSGFSGSSGTSGFSGYSGTSGRSGYSGTSGVSGFSGATGATGATGASGIFGGDTIVWNFDSTLGSNADPGSGNFTFDTGRFDTLTLINLDARNSDGVDVRTWLASISLGDTIRITQIDSQTTFIICSIKAILHTASSNSDYYCFQLNSPIASGPATNSIFTNGRSCTVSLANKGTTGSTGTSGASGFSGVSGGAGASGVSGFSGMAGAFAGSGYSGFSGASGFSGISGFSGQAGPTSYVEYFTARKTGTTGIERWYTGPITLTSAPTSTSFAKDTIRLIPFLVTSSLTLDRMAIEVTIAGTASSVARLGIYNTSNLMPTTLVLDAGTVAVDSTGVKSINISQALSPGMYVLALNHNSTSAPTLRALSGNGAIPIYGLPSTLGAVSHSSWLSATETYAAFTSDISAYTYTAQNGNLPLIAVRLS